MTINRRDFLKSQAIAAAAATAGFPLVAHAAKTRAVDPAAGAGDP